MRFSYTPDRDGEPDPGEVVWTWVPYEERDGRLSPVTSMQFPPAGSPANTKEIGFGLLGFHYRLDEKRNPLLAVVTSRNNSPVVRVNGEEDMSAGIIGTRSGGIQSDAYPGEKQL